MYWCPRLFPTYTNGHGDCKAFSGSPAEGRLRCRVSRPAGACRVWYSGADASRVESADGVAFAVRPSVSSRLRKQSNLGSSVSSSNSDDGTHCAASDSVRFERLPEASQACCLPNHWRTPPLRAAVAAIASSSRRAETQTASMTV